MDNPGPKIVAVLGGGMSPEHEVSLESAQEVLRHLSSERWLGWPVLLERDGSWVTPRHVSSTSWADHPSPFCPDTWQGEPIRGLPGMVMAQLMKAGVGLVWPALHGPFGEDGTVQGMLALHKLPHVGSGTAASAVAMDKLRTRDTLVARGLPMPKAHRGGQRLGEGDPEAAAVAAAEAVGLPCFVKAATSGSTLGVARAESVADLAAFLREHGDRREEWLVEQEVRGEEISVPVLGNGAADSEALLPIGIYPKDGGWFTHEAKYQAGRTDEVCPPRGLDPAQIEEVQRLAVQSHLSLGCEGLSRTDMIVTSTGPVILEVNSLPGMTRQSLLPLAAATAGIPFPDLLDRLLELAMARSAWQMTGASDSAGLPDTGGGLV